MSTEYRCGSCRFAFSPLRADSPRPSECPKCRSKAVIVFTDVPVGRTKDGTLIYGATPDATNATRRGDVPPSTKREA